MDLLVCGNVELDVNQAACGCHPVTLSGPQRRTKSCSPGAWRGQQLGILKGRAGQGGDSVLSHGGPDHLPWTSECGEEVCSRGT